MLQKSTPCFVLPPERRNKTKHSLSENRICSNPYKYQHGYIYDMYILDIFFYFLVVFIWRFKWRNSTLRSIYVFCIYPVYLSNCSCEITYLRPCFQLDTTWVPSKSTSISTLKADNAPVAPLVSWAAVITYHQMTCMLVRLVFFHKKSIYLLKTYIPACISLRRILIRRTSGRLSGLSLQHDFNTASTEGRATSPLSGGRNRTPPIGWRTRPMISEI